MNQAGCRVCCLSEQADSSDGNSDDPFQIRMANYFERMTIGFNSSEDLQ
jgi:hypothetical protein